MRKHGRTDTNQAQIVRDLRKCGRSVQVLSGQGQGCPDLLVANHGVNFLLEVKDPTKPKSDQKLTDDEKEWHDAWQGTVHIVWTSEQAIAITD